MALISPHIVTSEHVVLDKVTIGNNVQVGTQSIVWAGVSIGDYSVIAANSVVLPGTTIPANELWGGIPAKKIKSIIKTVFFRISDSI